MPGTLYVVATPIGNLEDVTLRALRVLREVALIAAEDTRRTARLLQHYSISTPTTSLHEHNERSKTRTLVGRLIGGESIALVSDAGTPLISDPGTHLVAEAHRAAIPVQPVPGANAAMAALSASGLSTAEFLFAGFPPARSTERKRWLSRFATEPRTLVFYEAPHRIRPTLEDMLQAFGDRLIALARELTKAHEQLVVRPITVILATDFEERGEFTVVVTAASPTTASELATPTPAQLVLEIGQLTDVADVSRREAIRTLARRHHLSNKQVFNLLEEAKK